MSLIPLGFSSLTSIRRRRLAATVGFSKGENRGQQIQWLPRYCCNAVQQVKRGLKIGGQGGAHTSVGKVRMRERWIGGRFRSRSLV